VQATRRSDNLHLAENDVSQNKRRRAARGGGGGKCTLRAKEMPVQYPDGEHYHAVLFLLIPPPLPCIPGRGTGDIALFFGCQYLARPPAADQGGGTKAEAAAAKGGAMSGADITAVIHAIFVAAPEQPCTRSSLVGKQQGAAFLAALPAPWTTLLAPARVACQAAAAAAAAATDAAEAAAAAAAVADHQPPAAPSVVAAGAVTAAAVDVASMSSAERRELLAKLGGFMGDE